MTAPTMNHATFISHAISCGHCVSKVQRALTELDGVIEVHASAETRFVDVDFDPEVVSEAQIQQALTEAGYPAQP